MGLGVRGVLLAVAVLASSTLATRPAVSGVCDASCDVDCQTCCKSWSLQATCSDGTVIGENGGFATPGDAATGAASMPAPSTSFNFNGISVDEKTIVDLLSPRPMFLWMGR